MIDSPIIVIREFLNGFVGSFFLCFESINFFYNPVNIVDNPFAKDIRGKLFFSLSKHQELG